MESESLASTAHPGPNPPSNRVAIFYLENDRLIDVLEGRFEIRGFPAEWPEDLRVREMPRQPAEAL